ncbi:hypothetical protein LRE75_35620 [Streptomyces sp. 372A]|uniref:hypothetical protein n=1 Tax=Streptomyces sp. SAS_281 TaxID=3412744 RepID=UPI00403CBC2A
MSSIAPAGTTTSACITAFDLGEELGAEHAPEARVREPDAYTAGRVPGAPRSQPSAPYSASCQVIGRDT